MSGQPALIDLRSADHSWRTVGIGGATTDVELARLHVDRATRASSSLVRFPTGWTRPGTGYYSCAEELLVLDGAIQVSGIEYRAGDYGYLPPYVTRSASGSAAGCLAVAWFSGVPTWIEGTAEGFAENAGRHGPASGCRRPTGQRVQGAAYVGAVDSSRVGAVDTELVTLDGWWTLVPAGVVPPALGGEALVRRWG